MHRLALLALLAAGCSAAVPAPVPVPVAEPAAAAAPQVENPQYTQWAAFKPGTAVTHKSVTAEAGHPTVTTTTTTYKLVEITADALTIEMTARTVRHDGTVTDNPPERFRNPKLVTAPPVRKSAAGDEGQETVTVAGKSYLTTWTKSKGQTEAGEMLGQVWTADDMPGQLVKSVVRIPAIGKTTTIEVVEVVRP